MAKTGGFANFSTGEKRTGEVLLPTKFTTASSANQKGKKFGNLVRTYAAKAGKVSDENNYAIDDISAAKIDDTNTSFGYGSRFSATGDTNPLFDSSTLNMTNEEMDTLENRLNNAQQNGNVLHEMAFSIRGDWLVENGLFDPETKQLDQDKLKRAEQHVVKDLFDKAFPLPLGESTDDVVWFGVIHQDTDHLNMHIWYAKESKETRPQMMHKSGEPKGVIDFRVKKQVESKFRYELESESVKLKRANVYEAVGEYRSNLKHNTLLMLDKTNKYVPDLQKIFEALPEDLRGRWKVGNTDRLVTDDKSRMAPANRAMNDLLNKMFQDELKDDYQEFKNSTYRMDNLMTQTHGQQHKGQAKWSEKQDDRLRKELANGIYRQFNENFKSENQKENTDNKLGQTKPTSFKKSEDGNFEKIRRDHGVGNHHHEPQKRMKATPVNVQKLNRMAKQMMQESKSEMKRMRKLAQEVERTNYDQSVSDESLSHHI